MAKTSPAVSSHVQRALAVLLAVLAGGALYAANAQQLARDAAPMPFGWGLSVVMSGSMEPALNVGDLLIVHEQSSYNVGDVVVFQSGTMAVVHRIVDVDQAAGTVTTKGDANNAPDDPMESRELRGAVALSIPAVGNLLLAVKTPFGIVICVALALVLVEASLRRDQREDNNANQALAAQIEQLKRELEGEEDSRE